MGISLGWASPALPGMQEELGGSLTPARFGWLGGLVPLGALTATPLIGQLLARLGRRGTILLACITMLLGWSFLCVSPCPSYLPLYYLGRFLTGLASAWFGIAVPVYIGELASPHLRGPLCSLFQNMVVVGILTMTGAGCFVDWRSLAYIAIPVPLVTFLLVLFLPPSPVWLVSQGRVDKARESLVWLRDTTQVEAELDRLKTIGDDEGLRSTGFLRDRTAQRIVLIMLGVGLSNQLCGINVILTYTESILTEAHIPVSPHIAEIALFVLMFLATMVSTPLNQRCSRRPLLLASLSLCSLSMGALGLCFQLDLGPQYSFLPLICLVTFILAFSLGMGPMVYILLADFSLPRLAATAGTVTGLTAWSAAFITTLLYPILVGSIGLPASYYLYAAFSALGAVFVLCALPETKGLTFLQIEASL